MCTPNVYFSTFLVIYLFVHFRLFICLYIFLSQTLRKALDSAGLQHVQIVAADSNFDVIAKSVNSDPDLAAAVSILGLVFLMNSCKNTLLTHSTTIELCAIYFIV